MRALIMALIVLTAGCVGVPAIYESEAPAEEQVQNLTIQNNQEMQPKTYSQIIVWKEPLMLKDEEVLLINDTHYFMDAPVELRNKSKLIIRNSLLEQRLSYAQAFSLKAYDESQVIVENSDVMVETPMNWDFVDSSKLLMTGSNKTGSSGSNPWTTFSGNAKAIIRNSNFDGTVWDNGILDIEDSYDVYIELVFEDNSIVDERLAADVADMKFPGENDQGLSYRVSLKNTTTLGWGISTKTNSIIWPWTGKTVVLENLEQKTYSDKTWRIEDTTLRLINTDVWFWSPSAYADNTLIIRNSVLSDFAFGGDESKTIIENSTVFFVRARQNQEFTIRDSHVFSDVIATENSKITLTNTKVGGKIVEQDGGKIIIE